MWLNKLFYKWKIGRIIKQVNTTIMPYALNRKECLVLLQALNINNLNSYTPILGISILITVRYPDIDVYSDMLTIAIRTIKKGKALPVKWDLSTERTISLDRFLISEGHYVDIVSTVKKFKELSIELCNIMENSDDAEYGLDEHNKRMLIPFLNSVRLITTELIKIA